MNSLNTASSQPLRNFDAYMAERITRYEPLERDDEPQNVPRLSKEQISNFFAKEKAAFADRTPEQEKKSLDDFFARHKSMSVASAEKHLEDLRSNPAFSNKSPEDLKRLADMRAVLAEGMEKKGTALNIKTAMIEKFDRVYSGPASLSKLDESLDFTKVAQSPKQRESEGLSL